MTKCIYCDFNHPDHIGAEIYSGEYISETEMYDSEWSDGFEYAYLKQKNDYFVLVTLHIMFKAHYKAVYDLSRK